jgi:hypothetical protein
MQRLRHKQTLVFTISRPSLEKVCVAYVNRCEHVAAEISIAQAAAPKCRPKAYTSNICLFYISEAL